MRVILAIICWISCLKVSADAGFPISREKAACSIVFTGTDVFKGYRLYDKNDYRIEGHHDSLFYKKEELAIGENGSVVWQDGRRRRWDNITGIFNLVLVDTATGQVKDSLVFKLDKHDLRVRFTGFVNGHLQYTADSTKAIYDYDVFGDGKSDDISRRNRNIFIGVSIAGFVMLVLLFAWKRKKNDQPNN